MRALRYGQQDDWLRDRWRCVDVVDAERNVLEENAWSSISNGIGVVEQIEIEQLPRRRSTCARRTRVRRVRLTAAGEELGSVDGLRRVHFV